MTRLIISPLLLTRVAGLPAETLDLVSPATRELIASYASVTDRLTTLSSELVETLFTLVPQLDDDVPLRRAVLAGKRSVNRLDPLPWEENVRRSLAARMASRSYALLDGWSGLVEERVRLLDQLREQLAGDRKQTIRLLHRALDGPDDSGDTAPGHSPRFAESLAIATPDWMRHRDHGARSAKKLKTLYSYVARASVKTSPFSGLTTVGEAGTKGEGRARSRTSATTAYLALRRLSQDESTAGLLRYRVPPLRPGTPTEPQGLVLHSEVITAEGVVWRHDRAVEADHAFHSLDGLPACVTLDELLAVVGGSRPFARFRRLLDAGLVHPMVPWKRGEDPFLVLAGLLDDSLVGSPIAHEDLERAHILGVRAWEQGAESRVTAAKELEALTAGWQAHDGRGERKPSGLVYEDRETDLVLPDPLEVPAVQADLTALGERMRPYLFRSHLYDFLLDSFVTEYGAGGICRDPLGFLMRLTVDRDSNPPFERALFADMASRREPGDRAWLPVGPTSAPPNAGVFFQLEAGAHSDVEAGRYRLVVNQFGAGNGGLFSRFGKLIGNGFRDRLAAHIRHCWPGVQCRELVVWTDCNTVQSECGGLLPPLVLPGEVGELTGATLDDTVLAHDAATNTLSLLDQGGAPVGLTYLGLIPQHLLQSYVRLLAVLADPWINGSPHSDYTLTKGPELRRLCGDDVVALPRVTDGPGDRIVTQRASWVVPTGKLPRAGGGASDEAQLAVRLDAFRRAHGIPEEVFVHQLSSSNTMSMTADRKPMWVSLASPLSVGVLHHWLSPRTTHLRLVEALPERSRHPQLDALGRPRGTEHVALLAWPEESRP